LQDFTDVIVVNEDFKTPSGLLLVHLPDGPTAYFRLTSMRTRKQVHYIACTMS
jgi:ribosome production factor 1